MKSTQGKRQAAELTKPPRREVMLKKQALQRKLDELQQYKRLLSEEGLKPDQIDKERESRLIQQLLGLEKDEARRNGPLKSLRTNGGKRPPQSGNKKSSPLKSKSF